MTAVPKPPMTLRQRQKLAAWVHVIPWRTRNDVILAADGVCAWCEVAGGHLDCHHVIRRSQGGKDEVGNLRAVHRVCHRYIHEHPTEAKRRGLLA